MQNTKITDYTEFIINREKKNKISYIIAVSIFILFIIGLNFVPKEKDSAAGLYIIFYGIQALFAVISLIILIKIIMPVNKFPPAIVKVLRKQAQDIVWIYITERPQYNDYFLVFGCIDKRKLPAFVNSKEKSKEEVLRDMLELFPQASFGYSAEYEQVFQTKPEQLRKSKLD